MKIFEKLLYDNQKKKIKAFNIVKISSIIQKC